MAESRPGVDPRSILTVLHRHRVDYVLLGDWAAVLHGAPRPSGDIDIALARGRRNLARLSPALTDLGARMRFPGRPDPLVFTHDPGSLGRMFSSMPSVSLVTPHGPLDIVVEQPGLPDYRDLRRHAVAGRLDGVPVQVASLDDLIRSKQVAGPAELDALSTLQHLRELQELNKALRIEPRLGREELESPWLGL
jgi:hypothetical protein